MADKIQNRFLDIGWIIVGSLVVWVLIAWMRQNREAISQIPLIGPAFNFIAPEIDIPQVGRQAQVQPIAINMPGIVIPSTRPPVYYPPTNSCGCGMGPQSYVIDRPTDAMQIAQWKLVENAELPPNLTPRTAQLVPML